MRKMNVLNILSSCNTRKRRSVVTRFVPAAKMSLLPRRHRTVSFINEPVITHVNKASLPSVTTVGPPVPKQNSKMRTKNALESRPNKTNR